MKELQNIGYRAFAYGFLADDIQTAYTTTCTKCTEPQVVDVMRSLVLVGKLQVGSMCGLSESAIFFWQLTNKQKSGCFRSAQGLA